MRDENANIAHRDWRLHAITTTTEPFKSPWTGFEHPPGTVVELAGSLVSQQETFAVPVADAAAMFVSLAESASFRGRRITDQLAALPPPGSVSKNAVPNRRVDDSREAGYFDAVQELMATVVFAYSAAEALANQLLPAEYRYRRDRSDGRCTDELDRTQIERYVPLDEKLHLVLPAVLAVSSPKGSAVWQRFVRLERLRNRLIHLKREDWRNLQASEARNSIWSDLVAPDVPRLYHVPVELAGHFTQSDRPRWVDRSMARIALDTA